VAIPGLKTDGHAFIGDAVSRGARFIVHEGEYHPPAGVSAIAVRDSRRSLGILGKNLFGNPSAGICLIAVVGRTARPPSPICSNRSSGPQGTPSASWGRLNYRYAARRSPPEHHPESFEMQRVLRQMADAGVTHVVAEVSSHAIDLKRVDDCAFDLGVFTNLTQDHLDYHGTMENYFQAKRRFFAEVLPGGGKTVRTGWSSTPTTPGGGGSSPNSGAKRPDGSPTASNPPVTSPRKPFRLSLAGSRRRSCSGPNGLPSPPRSWAGSICSTSSPPPPRPSASASPDDRSGTGSRH